MVSITNAPTTPEELGIILLIDALSGRKTGRLNGLINKTLTNLCDKGLVAMESGRPVLTEKAEEILGCINKPAVAEHNLLELAKQMRELFPKGMKPNSNMSGGHPWRCSISTAVERLRDLLEAKPNDPFTDEEALEATRAYVERNSGSPFMRIMSYFIIKEDDKDRTKKKSDLIDWIYIIRDGVDEEPTTINDLC